PASPVDPSAPVNPSAPVGPKAPVDQASPLPVGPNGTVHPKPPIDSNAPVNGIVGAPTPAISSSRPVVPDTPVNPNSQAHANRPFNPNASVGPSAPFNPNAPVSSNAPVHSHVKNIPMLPRLPEHADRSVWSHFAAHNYADNSSGRRDESWWRRVFANLPGHANLPKGGNERHNGWQLLPNRQVQPVRPGWPVWPAKSHPPNQESGDSQSTELGSDKNLSKAGESMEEKPKSNSRGIKSKDNKVPKEQKEESSGENKSISTKIESEDSKDSKEKNEQTSTEKKSEKGKKDLEESKDSEDVKEKSDSNQDEENDDSNSKEQKELIKKVLKKLKDNKCDEDDIYPDPRDCNKFYLCVEKSDKTKLTHLRCDSEERFDSEKLKCVNKHKAKCLTKQEFIEEFA
ncbi:PREDICTED: sporozoite surface protein 2-like, partial [Rhagoletis zephyria]|uniref:sporozoite surface protein 2-like n=1 Tax=Rhagoletis zephyria TaxID=28612 RepID=UPI000811637C